MTKRDPFLIGGHAVAAGTRRTIDLPIGTLADHTPLTMSVHVVHGRFDGPTLFVSAAIHGDEIVGVEIARRLLRHRSLGRLRGTLLVAPIVNGYGFVNQSRYLPDRRDLNRSFPGSETGSLASRLAYVFFNEVVLKSDYGIDLHSAAVPRANLPQLRISEGNERSLHLAQIFGAPVTITSRQRENSLRYHAEQAGVALLLYEAGESLRFDEMCIRAGTHGSLRVLTHLNMLPANTITGSRRTPLVCESSRWNRAPSAGLLRTFKTLGDLVEEGTTLGVISDPLGEVERPIRANTTGLIIGRTNLPLVYEGDALFHIAETTQLRKAASTYDTFVSQWDNEIPISEDEIR